MAGLDPAPLNAYQRSQLDRQRQERERRVMELVQSRAAPIRVAEEDEARQTFLSRRRRSPTFVLDPPPHRIQQATATRHTQQLWRPGTRSPQLTASWTSLPTRPRAERHMRRLPALRTPSPPRTPLALSRLSVVRLYEEENAFSRTDREEPRYSEMSRALPVAASRNTVPWAPHPVSRVFQQWRLPVASAPPLLREPAALSVDSRLIARSAAIDLLPSPSKPALFRPEPRLHLRTDKQDGGRKQAAERAELRTAGESAAASNKQAADEAGTVTATDEQHDSEHELQVEEREEQQKQRHDHQPSIAPQRAQQTDPPAATCPSSSEASMATPVQPVVQSSADIERSLAACSSEAAATHDEKTAAAEQERAEAGAQQQQMAQQPASPLIEVDGQEERAEVEPAHHVQSDSSAVSSHFAFVGAARYDGTPWVRQLLTDNGIHVVEFDDERCNTAFVESDYTSAQLGPSPIAASKEEEISFYDMQYIRDTALGTAKELSEYRLSKPSERRR